MNYSKDELIFALKDSWNMTEVSKKLGCDNPGDYTNRKLRRLMKKMDIDFSHLKNYRKPDIKYPKVEKSCPVCNSTFKTQINNPKEKTVCSRGCANTFFRSGESHPNYKEESSNYRKKALRLLENKCNRCSWDVAPFLLEVHHKDRDRANNDISNLEILCKNCHAVEHYSSKDGPYTKWITHH